MKVIFKSGTKNMISERRNRDFEIFGRKAILYFIELNKPSKHFLSEMCKLLTTQPSIEPSKFDPLNLRASTINQTNFKFLVCDM